MMLKENSLAVRFSALYFFAYINFTEIDVKMRHDKIPQDFSTGVEFVAICLIYVKRW